MKATYNVLTWDPCAGHYTVENDLGVPCENVSWSGLRRALKKLRTCGYDARRGDPSILVERTDDPVCDALLP